MENKAIKENFCLFISYASEDIAKVKVYEEALKQNGLEIWIDQQDIQVSDSIVNKINTGIKGSKYAIIFYSNSYKNKIWTQEEMAALIFAAISSEEKRKIFVIRLDDTELPPLLAHRAWADNPAPENFAKSIYLLINEQTEKSIDFLTYYSSNKPIEKPVDLADLDNNICAMLAKSILDNYSKSTIELLVGNNLKLLVEIWNENLTYDITANLKYCLNMIYIHNNYINDLREELAENVLGKFKTGFRLELEKRMLDLNTMQNELINYLTFVCKKLVFINKV